MPHIKAVPRVLPAPLETISFFSTPTIDVEPLLVGGEELRPAGAEVLEPGGQVADLPGQMLRVIALGERNCKVNVLHRRVSMGMRMR